MSEQYGAGSSWSLSLLPKQDSRRWKRGVPLPTHTFCWFFLASTITALLLLPHPPRFYRLLLVRLLRLLLLLPRLSCFSSSFWLWLFFLTNTTGTISSPLKVEEIWKHKENIVVGRFSLNALSSYLTVNDIPPTRHCTYEKKHTPIYWPLRTTV